MKTSFIFLLSAVSFFLISSFSGPNNDFWKKTKHLDSVFSDATENLDWKLAVQTYTLNRFTFEEALDKIQAGGFKYVEAYPSQDFGAGIEGKTHFSMDDVKKKK